MAAGLRLTEAGIVSLQDIDSNGQRQAITRQESMMMFACYKEILKENNSCVSRHISVFVSSSCFQGLALHRQYCWSLELAIHLTGLQFKRKCLSLPCHYFVTFLTFRKLLVNFPKFQPKNAHNCHLIHTNVVVN